MREENISTDRETRRRKREKQRRINWWFVTKMLLYFVVLTFSVWAWNEIVNVGFGYAKSYVDTAIEHVRQENALNMQQLHERIDQLSTEMKALKDAVENTDETISGSTTVQKDIEERLADLDGQLEDLERSIKLLREAP